MQTTLIVSVKCTLFLTLCSLGLRAVGQDAQSPNRWEKDVIAFEKADRHKPPPRNGIVFVGSSSIRLWNLEDSFPNYTCINRGFGGARTSDLVMYADRIITKYDPSAVVVYVGGADIGARRREVRKNAKIVYHDFLNLCARIHAKREDTPILYISIKPSIKKWEFWPEIQKANALIKMHADKTPFIQYLDIVPLMLGEDGLPNADLLVEDGGHLNEKGYRAWSKMLKPSLKSVLRAQ